MSVATASALRPHLSSYDTDAFVRPVQRFVWEPATVASHPADAAGLTGRRLVVLGAHASLRRQVEQRLAGLGAVIVAADAVGDGATVDGILDLNLTGLPYDLDAPPDWRAALTDTTVTIQAVYDRWMADDRVDARALVIVTALGGRMGYPSAHAGPTSQPLGGIWTGLAKGLPRELPNLAVKIIDLDVPALDGDDAVGTACARVADALAAEYGRWDYYEVGLHSDPDGRPQRTALAAVEQPGPEQQLELGPDDLVLVSGGARGVGFAMVEHVAGATGCRVVVTGRKPLPTGVERDRLLDDARYQQWRASRRAEMRTPALARSIRAELAKAENDRAVLLNLGRAERAGLRVDYEACDVADAEQVLALIRRLPAAPTVIVHNAGIDEPARLVSKSVDIVLRTVDVKVSGFAALARAVQLTADPARPLKLFCNVGSLAGRMGGMIGQVDYAAGNDALARLGFWGRDHGIPTQTLCWPTWERLGVIANYDAAVRYVSTIAPDEGARRWLEEIRAGHTDEAVFLGQIGTALVPSQLRGFQLFSGHHDLSRLHALYTYLGTPQRWVPFAAMTSRHQFTPDTAPYLRSATRGGVQHLPASLAVELILAAADWVVPPGWPLQDVVAVENLMIDQSALALPASGAWTLTREATGSGDAQRWQLDVTLRDERGITLASARVIVADHAEPLPPSPDAGEKMSPISPAQLWTSLFPPSQTVAVNALERVLAGAESIARIDLRPGAQRVDRLADTGDGWLGSAVLDGEPASVLRVIR